MIDPFDFLIFDGLGALLVGAFEIVVDIFASIAFAAGLEELGRAFASVNRNSANVSSKRRQLLITIGLFVVGVVIGIISLQILDAFILKSPTWRLINFLFTPLLVAFVFHQIGKIAHSRRSTRGKLFTFANGYSLAIGIVLVRQLWAIST
jgi:hypothetical protein